MSFTTLTVVETFGNNDTTTLAASMDSVTNVATAVSIEGFPTDGQFRLLIDAELMLATAYDPVANQWQVTRGIEGTTATSHAPGADVTAILTRGALLTLKADIESDIGSSFSNVFTYRDSEPNPSGAVFATFMEAYAAASATGVPATIICDDTLNDCEIPEGSGDLDLHLITLSGISLEGGSPGPTAMLSIFDGVTWNEGFARITGNLWVVCNFNASTFLGTLANTAYYMRVDTDSMLATDNEGATFDCSVNSPTVYLTLNNGFVLSNSGSGPCFYTGAGSPDINVILEEASYFDDGLVFGTSGTVSLNFNSITLFEIPNNFSSYTGNLNLNYNALASLLAPFTGSGSFPDTTDFFPHVATGTMYFDQTSGQPYWWNGSSWGTPWIGFTINNNPPTTGKILRATSNTAATWVNITLDGSVQLSGTAAAGLIPVAQSAFSAQWQAPTLDGVVTLSGPAPTAGQIPIATSGTTATWAAPPDSGNVFIYRDSEPSPSGAVFSTWVGAYAAAAATGVPATIIIDNTLNGCQIPSGAGDFDLHQITLAGLGRDVGTTLFINDGVTWNEGFARITGGLTVFTFFSSSVYLGTFTSFTNKSMVIDEGSSLAVAVQGGLFNIQTAFNLNITLDSGSFIGSGGDSDMPAFRMNAGTNINLYMGDQTEIDGDFVQGPTGNLSINILSLSAITQTVFSQFSGTLSVNYAANAALLQPFTGSGSFPLVGVVGTNVTIGTMYFDQTSGQPWWWNGSAWVTVNAGVPGVELLTATAGSSQGTPVGNLNTGVQVSILVNTTGAAAFWHLPDGTDGMIKEIVSGGNLGSALISNAFIGVTSTNNAYGTNDLTDLNPGNSVRLVWSTAGGGWVAISSCNNASSQWD